MNEENKKQVIILVVLFVLLGGVLYFFVFKGSGGQPAPTQAATSSSTVMSAAAGDMSGVNITSRVDSVFQETDIDLDELAQSIKVVEFDYYREHESRNPTMPLIGERAAALRQQNVDGETPVQVTEDLIFSANRKIVSGIMWSELSPLAIIDNEVVTVGYEFDEPITVKSIERDHVVLSLAGDGLEVIRELKEH